eukprot:403335206
MNFRSLILDFDLHLTYKARLHLHLLKPLTSLKIIQTKLIDFNFNQLYLKSAMDILRDCQQIQTDKHLRSLSIDIEAFSVDQLKEIGHLFGEQLLQLSLYLTCKFQSRDQVHSVFSGFQSLQYLTLKCKGLVVSTLPNMQQLKHLTLLGRLDQVCESVLENTFDFNHNFPSLVFLFVMETISIQCTEQLLSKLESSCSLKTLELGIMAKVTSNPLGLLISKTKSIEKLVVHQFLLNEADSCRIFIHLSTNTSIKTFKIFCDGYWTLDSAVFMRDSKINDSLEKILIGKSKGLLNINPAHFAQILSKFIGLRKVQLIRLDIQQGHQSFHNCFQQLASHSHLRKLKVNSCLFDQANAAGLFQALIAHSEVLRFIDVSYSKIMNDGQNVWTQILFEFLKFRRSLISFKAFGLQMSVNQANEFLDIIGQRPSLRYVMCDEVKVFSHTNKMETFRQFEKFLNKLSDCLQNISVFSFDIGSLKEEFSSQMTVDSKEIILKIVEKNKKLQFIKIY